MRPDIGILHGHRDVAAPHDEARVLRELALVQATALPLAIVAYPGHFDLAHTALSDLGLAIAADGTGNNAARLAFATDFVLSAIVMFTYARSCAAGESVAHASLKRHLAVLAALGALIAIFPHDRFHTLHGVGCGAFIGSLWMVANLLSAEVWRIDRNIAVIAQTVLQSTVLSYALAYAFDSPEKQLLQKIAIVGLVVSLLLTSHASRHVDTVAGTEVSHAPQR